MKVVRWAFTPLLLSGLLSLNAEVPKGSHKLPEGTAKGSHKLPEKKAQGSHKLPNTKMQGSHKLPDPQPKRKVVAALAEAEKPNIENEKLLISKKRQLTFSGKRSGEGYFSADGKAMIFQSEREASNPFYQIYHLDLEYGDIHRITPGHGKTTCAWIHPIDDKVMFASTQDDPEIMQKQQKELDFRASGKSRRYSWDYDENYDIFESSTAGGSYKNLTNTKGYDAEGAYSPDGKHIVFASNRLAYSKELSARDKALFEKDKSYMMDIYIMNSDGTEVKQLTEHAGYDGGPFFSADGKRICWRRFAPNGATAEIYSMNLDGSDKQQLTRLGVMSWAPYFHPSGEYLIFATNLHGFANFELYLVHASGKGEPKRVTHCEGFDGLPVFSPDGKQLSWTSKRGSDRKSQIFLANWDHEAALKLIKEDSKDEYFERVPTPPTEHNSITSEELKYHIDYLASDELEGRYTATEGEKLATAYAAKALASYGFDPAGDNNSYYYHFEFTAGVDLGIANSIVLHGDKAKSFKVDTDWRPLAFSKVGEIDPTEIVFAGYGLVVPAQGDVEEYDSYVHLDVKDKWVMVFRYLPEDISDKQRQHLSRSASLRYKAMLARERGAKGLLIVSGPNSNVRNQLPRLSIDATLAGTSMAVLALTDETADSILKASNKSLQKLQDGLDQGQMSMGFQLKGPKLSATIDIQQEKKQGRNVIARFKSDYPDAAPLMIGAHIDHLGYGSHGKSLGVEKNTIHHGADDNASGVASCLEIAQAISSEIKSGRLKAKRDIIVALWSGEEIGLLGSNDYTNKLLPKKAEPGSPRKLAAYVNLDMVGRLEESLVLQGIGSSPTWVEEIEQRNVPVGLNITLQKDAYLPTDATPFYLKGIPILSAFTGAHKDYHTPRDTADKINTEGHYDITKLIFLISRSLMQREALIPYQSMKKPDSLKKRGMMRAYLGTIPDYSSGDTKGVLLSGVSKSGPADKAGVKGGDIIIGLGGKKIENIYDYTYAIETLKIGKENGIKIQRGDKVLNFKITPGSRE